MPTLWLLGFQGANHRGYRQLTAEPVLLTGHVGLSLDQGATIFGFTPFAPTYRPQAIVALLTAHRTFPGLVQDDRAVFLRAVAAQARGWLRSPVYLWAQELPTAQWQQLRDALQAEVAASPLRNKRYGWADDQPNVYNCATWPGSLGVALPSPHGRLGTFIPALRTAGGGQIWQS